VQLLKILYRKSSAVYFVEICTVDVKQTVISWVKMIQGSVELRSISLDFNFGVTKIWNFLSPSLRNFTSPATFRRHLKTHYCQQAFQST